MREEILSIIARECGLDALPALSAPLAGLDADSIDMVCTVSALEERFGIEFPLDIGAIGIETVGDIVLMVERRVVHPEETSPERPRPR